MMKHRHTSLEPNSGSGGSSQRASMIIHDNNNDIPDSGPVYVMYEHPPTAHRRTPSSSGVHQPYPQNPQPYNLIPETDLDQAEPVTRNIQVPMYPRDPDEDYIPHHHHQSRPLPPPHHHPQDPQNDYSDEDCLEDNQNQQLDDALIYGLIEHENAKLHNGICADPGDCPDDLTYDPMDFRDNHYRQMGIYGWRKKTIYLLLAVIVVLVGINAALTYWIVTFLDLSTNGISGLDLSKGDQIIFKGNASFERLLFASEVASYPLQQSGSAESGNLRFGQRNGNISFRSSWIPSDSRTTTESINLNDSTISRTESTNRPESANRHESTNLPESTNRSESTNSPDSSTNQRIESKLTVTKGKVVVEADNFEVYDRAQKLVFAINTEENDNDSSFGKAISTNSSTNSRNSKMTIRVDHLNVQDVNSLRLPVSLQTSSINSGPGSEELRILSPAGRLRFRGPKSIGIESKFGDTALTTFGDLAMRSNDGRITFESADGIYIRQLTLSSGGQNSSKLALVQQIARPKVYQLCICSNGKLFAVRPEQLCAIHSSKDCA